MGAGLVVLVTPFILAVVCRFVAGLLDESIEYGVRPPE